MSSNNDKPERGWAKGWWEHHLKFSHEWENLSRWALNRNPEAVVRFVEIPKLNMTFMELMSLPADRRPHGWIKSGKGDEAFISCPECGEITFLGSTIHSIDDTGRVRPSLVCPRDTEGCPWHVFARLVSWKSKFLDFLNEPPKFTDTPNRRRHRRHRRHRGRG